MADWKIKRGDKVPKPQAERSRESKIQKMFAFLGKADDLTGVTVLDLQNYTEHLSKIGNNLTRDHLTDILALFQIGDENNKFAGLPNGNPGAKIVLPPKRKGVERLAFTEEEARTILLAARQSDDPVVRWGHWLCASLGTIASEIADALVSHIVVRDGLVCMEITAAGRKFVQRDGETQNATLKTDSRTRLMPLPTALRAERFMGRVEYIRATFGTHASLFPEITPDRDGMRAKRMSSVMMRLLRRDLGIENELDPGGATVGLRDARSWRTRFGTLLEGTNLIPGSTPARWRYLSGHRAKDVHDASYTRHPPRDTLPILDALPNAVADDKLGG
jgi:hypothetical protein